MNSRKKIIASYLKLKVTANNADTLGRWRKIPNGWIW